MADKKVGVKSVEEDQHASMVDKKTDVKRVEDQEFAHMAGSD
jgi:hypothetical protein